MRNRLTMAAAALMLVSASLAGAQQPSAAAAPVTGSVDFGFRGGSVSGDEARFERYRDMRNGANINFHVAKETEAYAVGAWANNVGYRDGRYGFDFSNAKLKVKFSFDSTPLNYGYNTLTPWTLTTGGAEAKLTLDAATRLRVQNREVGVLGIPTTAAQAAGASIYRGLANPFELQSRRDSLTLELGYALTKSVEAEFMFASHKRGGYMPFGAAFAFNNAAEVPLPIDDRTNEFEVGIDWTGKKGMFRVAYERSAYANTYQSLVWDNPLRATDWNGTAGTGWDPSGYSNGNGPATGRLATSPDNSMNVVTLTGLAKLAKRTSLSGNIAVINMKQDDALIPWTTNPVIANATTYASYPYLATLPRATAQAEVKGLNASFVFNTRPHSKVNVTARYRHNSHDNQTPEFRLDNTVRFDAVPEPYAGETEPYTITQNKFDADASFSVLPYTSIKVGYGADANKKTYLAYHKLTDSTFRASIDSVGNQFITLRALFEHTKRSGSEFDQEAITGAGGQPNLRLFDDAERTRNRTTVLATLTPVPMFDVTLSYGVGKDDYDIGLNPQFGLLNNDNTVFNVGVNLSPRPEVSFGFNVGQEKFSSLQKSRNANPAPDAQWTDAARDWSLDNDETVRNVDLYLDLVEAIAKTDIRINYSFADSDQAFVHSGPRIASLAAANTFEAFPNVTNQWQRLTVDLKYSITPKIGIGAAVWHEKFEVSDFATINLAGTQDPRIDYLGGITMGYGNRPYKATTGFLRLFYLF